MIAHNSLAVYFNIHRAHDRASAIGFACCSISSNPKDPEKVEDPEYGTVWTGILTPRAFDKERQDQRCSQYQQSSDRDLAAPEVKKRKIRVDLGKNQHARDSGHIDHPG